MIKLQLCILARTRRRSGLLCIKSGCRWCLPGSSLSSHYFPWCNEYLAGTQREHPLKNPVTLVSVDKSAVIGICLMVTFYYYFFLRQITITSTGTQGWPCTGCWRIIASRPFCGVALGTPHHTQLQLKP